MVKITNWFTLLIKSWTIQYQSLGENICKVFLLNKYIDTRNSGVQKSTETMH